MTRKDVMLNQFQFILNKQSNFIEMLEDAIQHCPSEKEILIEMLGRAEKQKDKQNKTKEKIANYFADLDEEFFYKLLDLNFIVLDKLAATQAAFDNFIDEHIIKH